MSHMEKVLLTTIFVIGAVIEGHLILLGFSLFDAYLWVFLLGVVSYGVAIIIMALVSFFTKEL